MTLTQHYVNKLVLRAQFSTRDGNEARSELQEIAKAFPTTNGEGDAVRMAQHWKSGQLNVAACNQFNGRRKR